MSTLWREMTKGPGPLWEHVQLKWQLKEHIQSHSEVPGNPRQIMENENDHRCHVLKQLCSALVAGGGVNWFSLCWSSTHRTPAPGIAGHMNHNIGPLVTPAFLSSLCSQIISFGLISLKLSKLPFFPHPFSLRVMTGAFLLYLADTAREGMPGCGIHSFDNPRKKS